MESKYDTEQWAAETTVGRRIFNHNYRMMGDEIRGWELLKSVVMQNDSEVSEKIYIWQKKKHEGTQLVRIAITELTSWRNAQVHLQGDLEHSMRPEIPRGKGKLASIGDVNFSAQALDSRRVEMVEFVRGNLAISVRSVGVEPVDVSKVAKILDGLFTAPPSQNDVDNGVAEVLTPSSLKVNEDEVATVFDQIPQPVIQGGWLKIIVPDGELIREDDALLYVSPKSGRKKIEKFVVAQ